MKLMAVALLAIIGMAAASANVVPSGSAPVDRVVVLLKTLQETVTKDGETDTLIYNRNACWCETTATQKAKDIENANDDMRKLGQTILKLKGVVATKAAVIEEYNGLIRGTKDEQAEATALRQKENGEHAAESRETEEALASLEKAIKTLADATNTGATGAKALLQSSEQMESRNAVADVLEKLPSRIPSLSASLKSFAGVALLSEFVKAKAGYAPQSATIQGMLGDMYTTFATNLEAGTELEANRNSQFEKLDADLSKTLQEEEDTLLKNQQEKAEAEDKLAATSATYDATDKQRKADIAFFDETKDDCTAKHFEWDTRAKARSHEVAGLDKAISILTSDASRELFDRSIKPGVEKSSFLQIESTPSSLLQDEVSAASTKAYKVLKAMAKKKDSLELAALAVQARTSKVGHFDGVVASIDAMTSSLNGEAASDLAKKDECKKQYQSNTQATDDMTWNIEKNDAKIAKLQGLLDLRREQKADTETSSTKTQADLKALKQQRNDAHNDCIREDKDDRDAIKVLESAKTALARPTVGNFVKILDTAETRKSASKIIGKVVKIRADERNHKPYQVDAYKICKGCSEAYLHESDVQMVEVEDAMEGKDRELEMRTEERHSGASHTILAVFASIIEDLHNEIDNSWKAEAAATKRYLAQVATADQLIKDLGEKKVTLEGIIAERNEDKKSETDDKAFNNKELTSLNNYRKSITPDCNWLLNNFDARAKARAEEAQGLEQAKAFLAGQTALVQKSSPSLAQIRFLGMH